MYIPGTHSSQLDHTQPPEWTIGPNRIANHEPWRHVNLMSAWSSLLLTLSRRISAQAPSEARDGSRVHRRTTSHDIDTTIGIVVGVLLGVFLIASCAFLYRYRGSIRVKKRKRHHRHHKSSSSKSSKASDGGEPAAPPAPE